MTTYASINFKTKKELKEAVAAGKVIRVYNPGLGLPVQTGKNYLSGPWYPESHKWYAEVETVDGVIKKVK